MHAEQKTGRAVGRKLWCNTRGAPSGGEQGTHRAAVGRELGVQRVQHGGVGGAEGSVGCQGGLGGGVAVAGQHQSEGVTVRKHVQVALCRNAVHLVL
eukprot:1179297-Prorocentrum_minimum.AAC.2